MANLEETQESELDSILTELSLLEQKGDIRQGRTQTHSRSSSIVSGANSTISSTATSSDMRESSRTGSPDNDSAFSDTVSLLSSESSTSSGLSSLSNINKISTQNNVVQVSWRSVLHKSRKTYVMIWFQDAKSTKIQLALQKLEHASVRRLFVKAFSEDGSSKSLLVDERMNGGFVTKLLAGMSKSFVEEFFWLFCWFICRQKPCQHGGLLGISRIFAGTLHRAALWRPRTVGWKPSHVEQWFEESSVVSEATRSLDLVHDSREIFAVVWNGPRYSAWWGVEVTSENFPQNTNIY